MHLVFMLWLTLLLAVREVESLDFCFNASLEGSRLNSAILKKVNVSSMMECVVSCVQEPCCRSINYRKKLPQDLASLCEMLHDVVDETSAELEKNRFYDYIYFNAPRKEYDSSCVTDKDTTEEFDLEFQSKDIKNYILLDNNVPEMSNMTLMFWINTLKGEKMAVLSYAVEKSAKELSVFVQGDKIMLVFQSKLEFPVPPINDGYWHHVGVTWFLGQYSIYLDGTLVYSGSGLGPGKPLRANGVFAIGQKLSSTSGTFYSGNSFSGKLSQVNMWDYDFISTPGVNMTLISQSCSNPVGNIINWSALQDLARGKVVKEQPRSCKPLRNNPEYDMIITSPTKDIHFKTLENIPLRAVTITLWEKGLGWKNTKFVHYNSSTGKTLLSFCAGIPGTLILKIAGASETEAKVSEARVPTFLDKYWHHIATTWSSETGHWKIYLDGSLVSIMHDVASNITIPAGGELSVVPTKILTSLSRLNIWDYEIDGHVLSLMANKGPLFENGNVFAWYGVKSRAAENMMVKETPSDLNNSRSRSVYQMNFPQASTTNYSKIENVFSDDITRFTACFWAKILKTVCAIFTYSTSNENIAAYFQNTLHLDLKINGEHSPGPSLSVSAHKSWHFYCMKWQNSGGLVRMYQDVIEQHIGQVVAQGYVIPSNGVMVLGQGFEGSLAGLNFWAYPLHIDTIQGMAAGIINVNGNLLQWRDFMTDHTSGDVSIVERSEAEIPEYRVQALRDQWCKNNITPKFKFFTYARFVRNRVNEDTGYKWRCVSPMAMLDENMCYNISKDSGDYYSRNDILGIN